MKEQFIEEFTYRASEHLQACFGPKLREMQIGRIVLMQVVQASMECDYPVHQVRINRVHGGEVTVLINDQITIDIPLERRKEATHV